VNETPHSWRDWFEQYGPALVLYARQWGGPFSEAEDVVQEVFVKMIRKGIQPDDPAKYLFGAVRHEDLGRVNLQGHQSGVGGVAQHRCFTLSLRHQCSAEDSGSRTRSGGVEMNSHDQQFEAKLASLRPAKPSEDLVDRIALGASDQQPSVVENEQNFVRLPFRIWPVVAGLAAALLVALTIWFSVPSDKPNLADPGSDTEGDPDMAPPEKNDLPPPELVDIAPLDMDEALPSVGNYVSAMRESPESFDLLLQKHADNLMPPTGNPSLNELMKEAAS